MLLLQVSLKKEGVCFREVLIWFEFVQVDFRPFYKPRSPLGASRGIALLFSRTFGTRWGQPLPLGKTRYPFYRRLGGPQGRSGRAENRVPTGIRSRTLQLVVSRYID